MMSRMSRLYSTAVLLVCLSFLANCTTPVGVSKVSPREAYNDAYANPLNAGVLSVQSRFVLSRYNLLKKFEKEPARTIAVLHQKALQDNRADILYTLAEGSYLYGSQLTGSYHSKEQELAPDYFLLSALYSYYFIDQESSNQRLDVIFDYRVRNAIDMYNFGLWQGFSIGNAEGLALKAAERKLPFGSISISLDISEFPWKIDDIKAFLPVDRYLVRGLSVRNWKTGVGMPLIAVRKKSGKNFSNGLSVPATAILRIQGDLAALSEGNATAALELYSTQDTITINSKYGDIPLESDLSTPLAYDLEGSEHYGLGLNAFLGRESNKIPDGLYMTEPYRPGKIPVVFVHGTASNPVWWAEMFNTILFDPQIRRNYQFWYFVYTSNKAISLSATELRHALTEKLTKLDPNGMDAALQRMVIVGHSQGGLLAKYTVVDTGEQLVLALTGKSLESLDMSEDIKAKVSDILVVKPLPFVQTVIFLSTPHRGSYRVKIWNQGLLRFLISLPVKLVQASIEIFDFMTDEVKRVIGGKSIVTSADGLSPDNPVLLVLAGIPLAPGVKGHSIIAVKGDGDPKLGNDGVVEYKSAHLEGMTSELVINSGHSSQMNPLAIDEVRRILIENLTVSSPDILMGIKPGI